MEISRPEQIMIGTFFYVYAISKVHFRYTNKSFYEPIDESYYCLNNLHHGLLSELYFNDIHCELDNELHKKLRSELYNELYGELSNELDNALYNEINEIK